MMSRSTMVSKVLLVATCVMMIATSALAIQGLKDPTAEEIEKMEAAMPTEAVAEPAKPRKMLVMSLCQGFKHSSIPYWAKALEIMGEKTGAFSIVLTEDLNDFNAENLKNFDAVCLNNTTHLKLNPEDTPELCKSLMAFVKNGGGMVGIHAATDNFYDWPEAMEMMGGKFTGHPWTSGGTWAFKIDWPDHPLMAPFKGQGFKLSDEIYRTDPPLYSRDKQLVLMSLDLSDPATAGVKGLREGDDDTGITWIKDWGKGRMFYCSLGHNHDLTWTAPVLEHYLRGIQFAMGDFEVDTTPRPAPLSGAAKLAEPLKTYDFGDSREPLTKLSEAIRKAHGDDAKTKQFEKALLGVLESDAKYAGKQYACRELSIMGTEASVPVLAPMLVDEKLSDMARFALERIPGKAVNQALIGALGKAEGKAKIGIVNTLGQRKCGQAVAAIGGLTGSSDAMLAGAAISALGKIGTVEAGQVLIEVPGSVPQKLKMTAYDACLTCADQLVQDGHKSEARKIYLELNKSDVPSIIRTAAMRGVLSSR